MKKISKDKCPECGSNNVFYNEKKEQIICRDCGLILEEFKE